MEMDAIHSDDIEDITHESSEQLNFPYSSYLNGLYGEPELLPRVGNQYQAEIPDLIPEDDRLKLISSSSEYEPNLEDHFSLGLPIPVMWTRSEKFRGFREAEGERVSQTQTNGNSMPKVPLDAGSKSELAAGGNVRSIVLALPCPKNVKFKFDWLGKNLYPFPGSLGESWEEAEEERFLLGLYFLGKNLSGVQRFIRSKKMGDILSFYYGKFFSSNEYRRWADGRSLRSRRSVQGQKLLTGWRQQELLSRISSHVSDECKRKLLEASKAFRDEKMALEEYVFTLRDAVGMDTLMEAIGIGKGKNDLSNGAMDPPKTIQPVSANSEVPVGKACSSLLPADIVRCLTGGCRLSKARSSDLFWEAVWPRLLARGWHSEQPKDCAKNTLVFLAPGVKKFSRRRLVKGNHYFDSVTDVLNKVASEPSLLELEAEAVTEYGSKEEESAKDLLIKSDDFDDSLDSKKQQYLQPRKTCLKQDAMNFTIVDTSMVHVAERRLLREQRCLPVETGSTSTISPSLSSEAEGHASEGSENEVEKTVKSVAIRACSDSLVCANGSTLKTVKSNSIKMSAESLVNRSSVCLCERKHKHRKLKPNNPKHLLVGMKRSSLAACPTRESGNPDETLSRKKKPKHKKTMSRPNSSDAQDMVRDNKGQNHKSSSTSSIAEGPLDGRTEVIASTGRDVLPEITETHEDFDLNVSQIPPECEADGTITTDILQKYENSSAEQSSVQKDIDMKFRPEEQVNGEASTDQQLGRRQSRRSRPLTTKALEAFAFGFLGSPKKKRKDPEEWCKSSRSRSSRRVRSHTVVTAEFRNGMGSDASKPNEDG